MGGVFTVLFVLICNFIVDGTSQMNDIIDSCELSPILVPKLYDLKIDLDYHSRKFEGEVWITGQVQKETKALMLDSAVRVIETTLTDPDNQVFHGLPTSQNKTLEILFENPLLPNKEYKLLIKFVGEIRNTRGIFGANYTTSDGGESYFMATEFQPNYASYAFPCIDRPAYKAHYILNVSREAQLVALSNMPLSSSHPDLHDKNKIWDTFEKTPQMSSYTFAFVVADLVSCQPEDGDDPANNTVWVLRGNERFGGFASKWAPLYMKHLEKYTGIKYDMPKMDHVALPRLDSTAMENWGLITYKQEVLHLDASSHTIRNEFGIIWILAHEMAHQWFGNLVTCSSWTYTWLNEGITSFLHFLISGKVFPEWDMLGLMISEEVMTVMDDEGFTAVALTKDNCVMEATDTFSMASYYKGASVMRMVYYMFGEDGVKNGLSNYLKANKYGCVGEEDLWLHFEEEAKNKKIIPDNKTVSELMKTWSNNHGYPLVTVTRNKDSVSLEQARLVFFLPDDSPDQKWWIPLSYTTSSEKNFSKVAPRLWMNPEKHVTYLNVRLNKDDWIIFNIDQSGYYRVLYDNLTWASITKQLSSDMKSIPPLTRAKLIDDVFTLAFYKRIHYSIPLALSRYLTQETDYYPWSAAIKAFENIHFYMKSTDVNDKFEKYMLKLVENVFASLSNYDDYNDSYRDTNSKLLYGKILNFACNLGHKGCEKKALDLMDHLLHQDEIFLRKHIDEIHPLMCTMVRLGKQEIWDVAFEMYKKEKVYRLKEDLGEALKCTTDKEVWKKLLTNYFNDVEDYTVIDLFTSSIYDKRSYCYIIEVIENLLEQDRDRIVELMHTITDMSGAPMPEKCRNELRALTEKYIESAEEQEVIIDTLERSHKPWQRLQEIEEWFDEEINSIDVDPDSSDSGDNSLKVRSLYDGMGDDTFGLTYPHLRSPHDYDSDTRQGQVNQINSSASLEFNLYILIFSVLPSPIYLTYLLFAPLI